MKRSKLFPTIELHSNKDENEMMVSFKVDEENQVIEQEIYVYIPFSDVWLDIDHIMNEKAHKRATEAADGMIEEYLANVGR